MIPEFNKNQLYLSEWLGRRKCKIVLEYRGSRDGTSHYDFYSKVCWKHPTFLVAKSNHKKVFGAYITVPWRLPDGKDVVRADHDPDSFLFNLSKVHKIVPFKYIDLAVR